MKIMLEQVKCPVDYTDEQFLAAVRETLAKYNSRAENPEHTDITIDDIVVIKKALDARKKSQLTYVFSLEVYINEKPSSELSRSLLRGLPKTIGQKSRPVVVGSGPAGLFAALTLARQGLCPILIERGKKIPQRVADVKLFWEKGILLAESNVQFGEGGAGTFSDGKLVTGIKDKACRDVLETFVDAGASEEILYLAKPHIGTDVIRPTVIRIREKLIEMGATVLFETKLTGIDVEDGCLKGIVIENQAFDSEEGRYIKQAKHSSESFNIEDADNKYNDLSKENISNQKDNISLSKSSSTSSYIPTDTLVLAIGHSARDTVRMLYGSGVEMQAKHFSMGVRIEHRQKDIDAGRYGIQTENISRLLPPSEYKLACHLPGGRDVYTFCMCPGGEVIASASSPGQVVTNGMSNYKRNGLNANSALLVNVSPSDFTDFDQPSPLAGLDFQDKYEKAAFIAGGSNYKAPVQYVGDFLSKGKKNDFLSTKPKIGSFSTKSKNGFLSAEPKNSIFPPEIKNSPDVSPSYTPGVKPSKLQEFLPEFITESLYDALFVFDSKIEGFASSGAVMTGIESRSSSPVRITRDETRQSNIRGIFPCGEGAGYAGGIMSAAVDGINCAKAVIACGKVKI